MNDFAAAVEVNGRTPHKIDMSIGTGALSEVAVRVTPGDIKIAAAPPPHDTASRGGGD